MASDTDKAPYKAWLAELGQVMTRRDIATAMREYVRAHPHLWEPDDDPDTRGRWMKGSSAVKADVLANNVRRWIVDGSVPFQTILKRALISVVEEVVPEVPDSVRRRWPGQWEEFADALKAADTSNRSGQKRGGAAAKRKAQQDQAEKTANVVRAAGRPDDIDPAEDLLLGSSLFDDALPPYVARTADALVAARLADPASTPITVIVGPPKSGKTRSLFHLLSTMTPQPVTWWHNPAPGALDTLITRLDAVKNDPARPDVVILDDAGYNGVTPDTGLTAPRIRKIADLTTSVVLIVHSADLASWKDHATGGRPASALETMTGIGASPALVNLLDANTVDYSAELDDTELAAASQMLTDNDTGDFEGLDLTRLAEAMATVDKLHAAVQAAYEHGGMRAALVDAAIDATITDPAGSDIDWLQTLTQIHYRRLARNARWKPAQFDTEFDEWATTGFSPGSPHTILTRTDTHTPDGVAGERYRLLDALVPRLRAPDRDLTHLDPASLPTLRILHTTNFLSAHNRHHTAATWLLPVANRGNSGVVAYKLGNIIYQLGPETIVGGHTATGWWAIAAERGHADAAFMLGLVAHEIGTGDATVEGHTATQWWAIAARHGVTNAAFTLGLVADEIGTGDATVEGHTATQWLALAARHGHADAAYNLGHNAHNLGPDAIVEGHTATQWWLIAHEHGETDATFNLGITAQRLGPDAILEGHTATGWWALAAHHGHANAAYNLGITAHKLGPEAIVEGHTATGWWALAADHGHADAAFNLGITAHKLGPEAIVEGHTATGWWALAARHGHADAAYSLGVTAHKLGSDAIVEERTATQWWLIAYEHGHPDATYNLGVAAYKLGPDAVLDGHTAIAWWMIAVERGNTMAASNLAEVAEELGSEGTIGGRTALEWRRLAGEDDGPREQQQGP
ncbi:hypothetical protein ASG84_22040 [Rhodococcus sp. Leaf278]|uniref:tetratricopeptide repeat protein n=1 Tax=Rhodococcus sp. Leaf278 TaxID=1736319 RepID=UPI00070FDBFE|nr:sel1 repeat family protein [Rhodococcus sp. Leaf278]KQU55484.1 hypothetical protein ASG84_22040 [Rhodococcus sp. Leaf278]